MIEGPEEKSTDKLKGSEVWQRTLKKIRHLKTN